MAEARHLAAVDLGAETGRVVLGRLERQCVTLELVHRFDNQPLGLPDGLHWNLPSLFAETLEGLARAAVAAPLASIAVDAWGCDYALLDADGRMLGLPFHYRDRRTSEDVLARAHARVDRSELYRRTGIQTMPINTVFQLLAEAGGAAASVAARIALIPDLVGLWLTGSLANELTIASTTGLVDARTRAWAVDLIGELGLPAAPFDGELVTPGSALGPVLSDHDRAGAAAGTLVHAVGSHDTASAFAAAPVSGPGCAILSSGTWSLLGVELDQPCLGHEAERLNFSNEQGVCATVRLLRNIMGLWLLQECRRAWAESGGPRTYAELQRQAASSRPDVALFDPDDSSLLAPGRDMAERIAALCVAADQPAPAGHGEIVRSILLSLACKYRYVLEQLESVVGRGFDVIHVVGGGARNELLCRLTADVCQREVVAGPVEATALGNVLVQALALGELDDLTQVRSVVARSAKLRHFEPGPAELGDQAFDRFRAVTGLPAIRPVETAA